MIERDNRSCFFPTFRMVFVNELWIRLRSINQLTHKLSCRTEIGTEIT